MRRLYNSWQRYNTRYRNGTSPWNGLKSFASVSQAFLTKLFSLLKRFSQKIITDVSITDVSIRFAVLFLSFLRLWMCWSMPLFMNRQKVSLLIWSEFERIMFSHDFSGKCKLIIRLNWRNLLTIPYLVLKAFPVQGQFSNYVTPRG